MDHALEELGLCDATRVWEAPYSLNWFELNLIELKAFGSEAAELTDFDICFIISTSSLFGIPSGWPVAIRRNTSGERKDNLTSILFL
jgi:hypothetical protein